MFQFLEEISKKIVNKGFEVVDRNLPKSDGPASEAIKSAGEIVEEGQKGMEKTISPHQEGSEEES